LSEEAAPDEELKLDAEDGLTLSEELNLSNSSSVKSMDLEFSDDAMKKLEEIDAIMVEDASRVNIPPINLKNELLEQDDALNIDLSGDDKLNLSSESGSLELNLSEEESVVNAPLVKEDMNLDGLNFSSEEEESVPEEKPKKKKKEVTEEREHRGANLSEDLRQISGAYSGEMERLQATMSNLRTDREELLTKIQKLEDDKVMQNRQSLTMRAELDEKKIELTIIRKKLNEEISDLKDKLKLHDEKRLIIEEKNRILMQELDKSAQRNKIDVKKIQMREKELEQKLELLKADAETQIRNRDLKILELKRRLDSMEFDMESLSQQEKKSVESRFELEDKLEKAIKTLRTAINVLEDENERSGALSALKKNLDV
jgi:chromosome segregation ATPase